MCSHRRPSNWCVLNATAYFPFPVNVRHLSSATTFWHSSGHVLTDFTSTLCWRSAISPNKADVMWRNTKRSIVKETIIYSKIRVTVTRFTCAQVVAPFKSDARPDSYSTRTPINANIQRPLDFIASIRGPNSPTLLTAECISIAVNR